MSKSESLLLVESFFIPGRRKHLAKLLQLLEHGQFKECAKLLRDQIIYCALYEQVIIKPDFEAFTRTMRLYRRFLTNRLKAFPKEPNYGGAFRFIP
jgi:hypothetical protein